MADPPLDSSSDNRLRPGRGSPPGMPRWVKMFGLVAVIVVVVLFVIQHLSGLGGMGTYH
jgi:hypothetical protein